MHYSDFNNGTKGDDFNPNDIVDLDDQLTPDDDILNKFKQQ
jgi:hypothetical protein